MKNIYSSMAITVTLLIFSFSPLIAADNPFTDLISGSKIYFSHIATTEGWETEIAIINPTAAAVAATLTPYSSTGSMVGTSISVTLTAHGRYQTEVGELY